MNDMAEPIEKVPLTPRPEAKPVPVCTLLSDGSLKVETRAVGFLDLQRMLLAAASSITEQTLRRAMAMESVLIRIQTRFSGFDDETARALDDILLPPR